MIKNILEDKGTLVTGDPKADEIERETVVVAVYDQEQKKYLCQFWPEYSGLTCLLSGGVESGESHVHTVEREMLEETGYTDFVVLGKLGGDIEAHYTDKRGLHMKKTISPYFVSLKTLKKQPESKEADEKFDNLFMQPHEIIEMMDTYEQSTGSSMADHKEILKRALQFQNQ